MKPLFVRSIALLSLAALAACGSDEAGSDRLSGLKEGMTIQEALVEMGQGPLTAVRADTMRVVNGFRRSTYFINGSNWEIIYAREIPGDVAEPVLQARETPIVFQDGKLLGWGWRFYVDEAIAKYGLPTPLKAVDTMTTPMPTTPPADSAATDSTTPAATPAGSSQG